MEKQFCGAEFGILQDACGILWALSTKKEEDMECLVICLLSWPFFGQEVLAGELTEFNWFPQTKGCILGCVDDNLDWGNKNTCQHQTLESR